MKTVGIIAEYNPFHKGHAYQIAEAKKRAKAEYTIIVMSGNFLQRGEAACMDKFTRTKCALLNGADLVLELPVPFATSSAPIFAKNGVVLLHQTGVVTHLSFGCESDNLDSLRFLADFFTKEPEAYQILLKEKLKSGVSYPAARKAAFFDYTLKSRDLLGTQTPQELALLLDTPNNILALAYLRAVKELSANFTILPIRREGGGYHDASLNASFSSACAIRTALKEKLSEKSENSKKSENRKNSLFDSTLTNALPENTLGILSDYIGTFGIAHNDTFSSQLFYKLLSESKNLLNYAEITPSIEKRIVNHLSDFTTFSGFTKLLMRKNETYSTISRGLLHTLLEIKKDEFTQPEYLRVLGFKKEAAPLLHKVKEKSKLPLITKPADASKLLSPGAMQLLEKDFFAESLYHSAFLNLEKPGYHPYRQSPVIL